MRITGQLDPFLRAFTPFLPETGSFHGASRLDELAVRSKTLPSSAVDVCRKLLEPCGTVVSLQDPLPEVWLLDRVTVAAGNDGHKRRGNAKLVLQNSSSFLDMGYDR